MHHPDRRSLLAAAGLALGVAPACAQPSQKPSASGMRPQPDMGAQPNQAPRFSFEDVVRRARQLAASPYESAAPRPPEGVEGLDYDAWRDIRMKADKAIQIGQFKLFVFHLGHLYKRPTTVNTIRDGIAAPLPYSAAMFDFGKTKFDRHLPIDTGFAGFRLNFPINDPRVWDEVCSFVGASYFRILGRHQQYGLSARALTIGAGTNNEEFPYFREFWIELTEGRPDQATIYALLDGASVTGAFRFDLQPGRETAMEARANVFARRSGVKLGLAPLTSMYFLGENDRRLSDDYRAELHDSDGLQIETSSGEWMWRPLRNPPLARISHFIDANPRGFGLMQRDRNPAAYQDLDLHYQDRPSYWIEPREGWGEGAVELVELPTTDETNDNIVASFTPKQAPEAGAMLAYSYRLTALLDAARSPNGQAINTFQAGARALGSSESLLPGSRRFLIDFSGGDLSFYATDPNQVEIVASISRGRILRAFLSPNPYIKGLRGVVDVVVPEHETGDIRVFLRAGARTLTETWTFPWTPA